MPTSKRVSRLRAMAFAVLLGGIALAFVVGAMFPAQVVAAGGTGLAVTKTVSFTSSPEKGGESSFNWLFAILVIGPAVVASSVLYGAAEVASAARRGGRSRSSERGLEVGDEI